MPEIAPQNSSNRRSPGQRGLKGAAVAFGWCFRRDFDYLDLDLSFLNHG
jgi:hypothetical protein